MCFLIPRSAFAAGGILLSPLPLFGHGSEILFAKLRFLSPSQVCMEFTAQYGPDALLKDEQEARNALATTLRVVMDGSSAAGRDLDSLAEVTFTALPQLDPTAPPAYRQVRAEEGHSLVCASWTWDPGSENLTFCMPDRTPHDVVLWTVPPDGNMEAAKQFYLIPGDKTQPISFPQQNQSRQPASKLELSGSGIGLIWIGAVAALLVGMILLLPKRGVN